VIVRAVIFFYILSISLFGGMDYSRRSDVKAFVVKMHKKYGYSESHLLKLFSKAKHQSETLKRYQGRYKVGSTDFSWSRYKSKILIDRSSISLGKRFMRRYRRFLRLASKRYRVSPEIITAFIRLKVNLECLEVNIVFGTLSLLSRQSK